jgi:hypothetical protein
LKIGVSGGQGSQILLILFQIGFYGGQKLLVSFVEAIGSVIFFVLLVVLGISHFVVVVLKTSGSLQIATQSLRVRLYFVPSGQTSHNLVPRLNFKPIGQSKQSPL